MQIAIEAPRWVPLPSPDRRRRSHCDLGHAVVQLTQAGLLEETAVKIQSPYQVGSALAWNHPAYLHRDTDTELIEGIELSKFCYVLGSARIGKSSLRLQASHQLEQIGYRCASLDGSQILDSLGNYYRWEKQLITALWNRLHPNDSASLREWEENTTYSLPQYHLEKFTRDLLLENLAQKPVVIFIDNIEALTKIPFLVGDLLDWICHCYRLRKIYPIYNNLNFVVLGEAIASDLYSIPALWSSGKAISINPFTLSQLYPLGEGFNHYTSEPKALIDAVYGWTGGQPFLTQLLCQKLQRLSDGSLQMLRLPVPPLRDNLQQWVNQVVRSHLLGNQAQQNAKSYFDAVRTRIAESPHSAQLWSSLKAITSGQTVAIENDSRVHAELLLTGLAVARHGQLRLASQLHHCLFFPEAARGNRENYF